VADTDAAEHRADLALVDVDDTGDGEPPLAEAAVAGERLAEVAGADDDDRQSCVRPSSRRIWYTRYATS
jgi:hypothetical protein